MKSKLKEQIRLLISSQNAFKHLTSDQLQFLVDNSNIQNINASEVLISQGEIGDSMYIVVSGRLSVWVENNSKRLTLSEISTGDIVGEMALLSNELRAATVEAITDSELVKIDRDIFTSIIQSSPKAAVELYNQSISRLNNNFSGWFAMGQQNVPKSWRQTMIVLLAIFPVVVLQIKYLNPLLEWLPFPVALFFSLSLSLLFTSSCLLPIFIYFFDWWLFPSDHQKAGHFIRDIVIMIGAYTAEISFFWWLFP